MLRKCDTNDIIQSYFRFIRIDSYISIILLMANQAIWTWGEAENSKKINLHIGDTIRVHYKLIEKEKVSGKTKREVHEETHERTQVFEGILLAIKHGGDNCMISVRHMGSLGIGVERIFPLISPWIKKIEVKKSANVRRAKLYYLRDRKGREATRLHEQPVQASIG